MLKKTCCIHKFVAYVVPTLLAFAPSPSTGTTTTTTTTTPCLPDAVSPKERQNIVLNGKDMPIGIWGFKWDSAELAAQIYKILVQEKLGYNAEFDGWSGSSSAGLYAVACCQDPMRYSKYVEAGCGQDIPCTAHVVMEIWGEVKVDVMTKNMQDTPEIIPESLGSIGYVGKDGLFVKSQQIDNARSQTGLHLMYCPSYDAFWHKPWTYFERLIDIAPESLRPCNETTMIDANQLETYVRVTGDWEGVNKSPNGTLTERCWGRWWLAPACRSRPDTCIPVVTGGTGWGVHEFQQKAATYNMPLAVTVSDQYEVLARKHRVLFYHYTPSDMLADQQPRRVLFPEFDMSQWKSGDMTTMATEQKLSKWVHNKFVLVAPLAYGLAKNMVLSEKIVDAIIADKVTSNFSSIDAAACRWIRDNRVVWQYWIPNRKLCDVGMGLSRNLSFVADFEDADGCTICFQGRYSFKRVWKSLNTRICKLCPEGTFSDTVGATECKPAPPGYYVVEQGQWRSIPCEVGTYASEEGHRSCTPCSDLQTKADEAMSTIFARTTALLGASSVDLCLCPGGSFPYRGGCAQCQDFRGLECQETYGMSNPKLLEGFMSFSQEANDSIAVYKCSSTFACQGKREAFVDPMCTNLHRGVACENCLEGFGGIGDVCVTCDGVDDFIIPAWVDFIIAFFAICCACTYVYFGYMRPETAQRNISGMVVGFLQTWSVILSSDVAWPEKFVHVWRSPMTMGLPVRTECFTGDKLTYRFVASVCLPFALQLAYCCIFVFWRFAYRTCGCRSSVCKLPGCLKKSFTVRECKDFAESIFWPIKSVNIFNVMQRTHLALFVAILEISLSLFKCRRHPSGIYTVTKYPDVECGSDEWWDAIPIAFVSVLVYCISFMSWILYLIWQAPFRVGNDPLFANKYDFIWARWHPRQWWFTMAQMLLAMFVNCIQIFTSSGYLQMCLSAMSLTLYMITVLCLKPHKFSSCNKVDGCVKCAMVFICIIAIVYVDMTASELEVVRKQFEPVVITMFLLPLLIALTFLVFVMWRRSLGTVHTHTERLYIAQRFRDVMAMASHLSNLEFNRLTTVELAEQDRLDLLETTDVLIAHILKMQPSERFLRRRILPGTPYVVADNHRIHEAMRKRGLHDLPAIKERRLLHTVATELLHESLPKSARKSKTKALNKLRGMKDSLSLLHCILDRDGDGMISRDEFTTKVVEINGNSLTEEQIHLVFDLIDLDGNGEILVDELCAALQVALDEYDIVGDVQDSANPAPASRGQANDGTSSAPACMQSGMPAESAQTPSEAVVAPHDTVETQENQKPHDEQDTENLNSLAVPKPEDAAIKASCALWAQWLPGGLSEGSDNASSSPWGLLWSSSPYEEPADRHHKGPKKGRKSLGSIHKSPVEFDQIT